jgi:chromosome segregation ATPase
MEKLVSLYQQLEEENQALLEALEKKDAEIQNLRKSTHWLESRLSQIDQREKNGAPNSPSNPNYTLLKAKIQELKAEIDHCLSQLKSLT